MANTNRYLRTKATFVSGEQDKEELIVSAGEVPYDIRTMFKYGATKVRTDYADHCVIYTMHERNE
jgi:hypothetical protein